MTYVAPPSGGLPGNILSPADSDFESGYPTWSGNLGVSDGTFENNLTGWNSTDCTIVRSNAHAHSGAYSLEVTVTGTPAQAYVRPVAVPVIPGVPITPVSWVMATSAETFHIAIDWWDENNNYLSTTASASTTPATFTWAELTETVVPPANARNATYGPTISVPAAGSYFYTDDITLGLNSVASGLSPNRAFTGNMSLAWSAQAAQDAYVASGLYPCLPNKGYDFSGVIWTDHNHDIYIGVQWYDAFGSPLGSVNWSQDFAMMDAWQPLSLAGTSPSNATQFKIVIWVGTNVAAGETFYLDLMYAAQTPAQILVDWCNPTFSDQSAAGACFFDVTPWVRFADNIQLTRGRQSRVSEMSAGSGTFNLQNDDGWFTKYDSNSPISTSLGGVIDIGARCQVNVADETGTWHTRFDGQVAEIDQNVEAVGTTAIAVFTLADVLAYLNRQSSGLYCWTKSLVMSSAPWLHWSLNDANNAGSLGVASETAGNNGPALHPITTNTSTSSIQWGNTNGGVETLADASAPGKPDMWEFWQSGSDTPSSDVNALEATVTGPYTTPLPSAYFTPHIVAATTQNDYTANSGYILTGILSPQVGTIAPSNGSDYSVEAWFAMDPWIGSHASTNMGPYVVVSLGNSRTGSCLQLGVWNSGNHLTAQAMTYGQPPAFSQQQYGTPATPIASVGAELAMDKKPLPHHFVANITGANNGATLELFVDGISAGTTPLPAGVVYDTITVGGAHGGWGCFYGNIQLVSIYQRKLSGSEIRQHCNFGQYGMWESTTDNCIAQLAEFANIPPFWNGLTAGSDGLSLTDYYDITNWSPLLVMQVYEQAEQGLLYVASNGALTFATRDQREGHGAPDVLLPPDTYTASLGYQLIDQYILNQSSVSTATYQNGVVWRNLGSNDQYGPYANGSSALFLSGSAVGSYGNDGAYIPSYGGPGSSSSAAATPLPLITWSRSYAALGLPQYTNSPDPVLNDLGAWKVNTQSESRQTYSSLTLDLLTLDPASGLTVSQLYGLDINGVIGLSGELPTSIANAAFANEMFVEGVNETIGLNQWTLELYTSPADVQRAWIPGDPVYGALGSTTRVGLSAADTSVIPAIGKDVAHDAGGPYWPPSFIVEDASLYQFGYTLFTGTTGSVTGDSGLKRVYQGDAVLVSVMCPAAATITVGPDSAGNTYAQVGSVELPSAGAWSYVFVSLNSAPLNSSDSIPVTGSVSQDYIVAAFGLENVLAVDGAVTTGTPMLVGSYLYEENFYQPNAASALDLWNSWTGEPSTAVRYYKAASDYTYTADLQSLVTAGARIDMNFNPAYNPVSSTDLAAIESLLITLKGAGADVNACLWHEPGNSGLTAAQFISVVQYYGPTIRKYYPLWGCLLAGDIAGGFYPGDEYFDGLCTDEYWYNGTAYGNIVQVSGLANSANPPKPFGIWEFNAAPGPNYFSGDTHTFAASAGNWVAGSNCSVAWQSGIVNPFGVDGCLGVTSTAGDMTISSAAPANYATQMQSCAAGDEITVASWLKAATTGRTCVIGASFYNATGAFVSTVYSTDANATATDGAAGWNSVFGKVIAPANTDYYHPTIKFESTASGEVHYIAFPYCADSTATGATQAEATAFWQHIQSYMADREAQHLANGDVLVFNEGMPGSGSAVAIQHPADYRVDLWRDIYVALNNTQATGMPAVASSGTGTTSSVATADMPQPYDLELIVDFNNDSAPDNIPPGWNYGQYNFGLGTLYNSIFWKQNQGEYNGSWDFEDGIDGWGWYAPGGTVSVTQSNVWASSGTYSLLSTVTATPTSRWYTYVGITDVMPGDTVTFTATVHSAQALSAVYVSVDWKTSTGAYLSSVVGTSVSFNAGETQTLTFTTPAAPATTRVASLGINVESPTLAVGSEIYIDSASYSIAGPVAGEVFSATHASTGWGAIALTFTMQPTQLNNPSGSGNQFIGSLEMRGLHDTLATALRPPMTIVGDVNHGQNLASGNVAAPEIVWDQIFVDTAGGMSAIPGWQNWYVCTVPGFYEVNGCARMTHNTATGTCTGYIAVASQAAQAILAGTATPETVNQYVCPVGAQHQFGSGNLDLAMSASTRIYLGVGDMVALCETQNTGATQVVKPLSIMSIRWCGYSTANDQVEINSSLGGSGTTTKAPTATGGAGGGGAGGSSSSTTKKTYETVWGTTSNYAYWGTSSSFSPQLRSKNGTVYQGMYAGGEAAGSQFAVVVINYSAMQAALSGATINWIKLTCTNEHFWYNSGGKLILGWSSRGPGWGNYYSPNGHDHFNQQQVSFREGQKKTFYLGSWSRAIASTAKALLIGNNNTRDLQYYSYWSPSFVLTVNYTK